MKVFVSSLIAGMEPLRAAAKAAIEELGLRGEPEVAPGRVLVRRA
jgi:hypothetical protein